MVSEMKAELAKDVYELQDKETKAAIDKIIGTLRSYSESSIKVLGEGVDIHKLTLDMNLLYLAVEVVKDLGLVGYKVANFHFPTELCAACGSDLDGS